MLAGTDDHLTWLSPVILNLENMGLTHLESEIRVTYESVISVKALQTCKKKPLMVLKTYPCEDLQAILKILKVNFVVDLT